MITDSFDTQSKPIITLKDFYGEQKHIVDKCIITFSSVIQKSALDSFECEQIAKISACNGGIQIYSLCYNGQKIAFYLSPIGSTMASQCLVEANWLTGASKFVMFGSSGSLSYEKTQNRIVIPTEAYRDEGMSYHYAPPSDYITVKNCQIVRDVLGKIGVPYVEGKTWTTDAILRETVGQMGMRKAEGCVAVEMEIAGVQSVCDFYGLDLYTFIATGDVLSDDGYSLGTLADANHNIDNLKLALELASRVS